MRMRRCSLNVNLVIRWRWPSYTSRSESGTSDSDGLVSKSRGAKSSVWIYFGFEADEEGRPKVQDAVICRLCKKTVSAKGGNTSNLLSHLKVHLPQQHLEVKKANSKPSGKGPRKNRQGFFQVTVKWQYAYTSILWYYYHIKYQYWISHTAQHYYPVMYKSWQQPGAVCNCTMRVPTELQKISPFTRGLGYVSHVLAEYKIFWTSLAIQNTKKKSMLWGEWSLDHPILKSMAVCT